MSGKRKGRPPKAVEDRKRRHLTFRVTDRVRDLLAAAANAAGRSISEEIEHRLERSFVFDALERRLEASERRQDEFQAKLDRTWSSLSELGKPKTGGDNE
jgi:uncharacterized protein (DUF1778 family)